MKLSVIAFGLLTTGTLIAQAPPAEDGPHAPVSGRVLTGDQPVRGAQVSIDSGRDGGVTAETDAAGRWTIPQAPSGEGRISVRKAGYADQQQRVLIPAAGELKGLDLSLDRPAVLSGRLTDHRNRPVVGAQVTPMREEWGEDGPVFRLGGRVRPTDDRGLFRVWDLQPGRYILAVVPKPRTALRGEVRLESSIGFYPGVVRMEDASPIELGWGTVREGLDIQLGPAARTELIVAAFATGSRTPCAECWLQVFAWGGSGGLPVAQVGQHSEGVFRVTGLPPGDYVAAVQAMDRTSREMAQAFEPVQLTEDRPEELLLETVRPAPLPVRITLDEPPDDFLAPGAPPWRVQIQQEPVRTEYWLQFLSRSREMFGSAESSGTEAQLNVATLPGRRRLNVRPPEGAYVAAATLDGRPLESMWLNPPPQGFSGELALRLRFDGGRIEGIVQGVRPPTEPGLLPPPSLVLLEPDPPDHGFATLQIQPVQKDGNFSLSAAPGAYNAVVVTMRPGLDVMRGISPDPDLRKRSKRVEVKAGQTTQVTLELK